MKFYLAEPRAPKAIDDTGFHPATRAMLEITPGKSLVALPNAVASPAGYQLIGEGADLAKQAVSKSLRTQLTSFCGLTEDVRSNRIGKALFEAKTIGSPGDTSTLEPNRRNVNLYFMGRLLHRERFDRAQEYAQKVIAKKRNGYAELRGRDQTAEKRQARKWLHKHLRLLGLSRDDIQGQYKSDGEPIDPETVVSETGTPDQTWSGDAMTFSSGTWSFDSGNHKIAICDTAVSDGDHRTTLDVSGGAATGPAGPVCRAFDAASTASKYCYVLYWYTSTWYVRKHYSSSAASFATIGTFSRTADYNATHWIEASGSDITVNGNGEQGSSPYTDTSAPDTHLYGGCYAFWEDVLMDNWELSDEVGGGGGGIIPQVMHHRRLQGVS